MAYQMAATIATLNDLEGHSQIAGLFKCNPSNICATFYTISTDNVLARFLCISGASCFSAVGVRLRRSLRKPFTDLRNARFCSHELIHRPCQ